jgi:hypothetical protein
MLLMPSLFGADNPYIVNTIVVPISIPVLNILVIVSSTPPPVGVVPIE